ncbi:hypothetical protein [Paremcibacter congregatus]|uniref:hypothetical protein n=1 Tax=Paremcibacter congregatus TaxID=2043170 RepID=UPI003A8FD34B
MRDRVVNINGKTYAINVITPIKPWTTFVQKVLFWFVGIWPKATERLVNLSFIHFARWVIVRKGEFPHLGEDQPREELNYDYLLFNSNFNGTWVQYIDAFSDVLPDGLNSIWNWSVKFPGSRPEAPFIDYIRHNQLDVEYFYNAYPGAAVNDIKAAKNIMAQTDKLADEAADMLPDDFLKAYHKMLLTVQKDLGRLGVSPEPATD